MSGIASKQGFVKKEYSHFLHRHNFSAWAAARAAQRRWRGAKVPKIVSAIERSGLESAVADTKSYPLTSEDFDSFHRRYAKEIISLLRAQGVASVTYGRAAKIIAIYLKSMVVIGPLWDTPFARVIHPPLDQILLCGLASRDGLPKGLQRKCKTVKWTKLSEDEYFDLIQAFRQASLDEPAFWMLEQYWKPS
jgi:hypothetical protein